MSESRSSSPSTNIEATSGTPSPAPSYAETAATPDLSATAASPYQNGFHAMSPGTFPFAPSPAPGTPLAATAGGEQPLYVKRPLNAYMIWTRGARKKILAKDPKMKMNDVSRLMGEIWKGMTDKEKKPYFDLAKKNKLQHKQDYPNYSYQPQRKKTPKNPPAGSTVAANGHTPVRATSTSGNATTLTAQLNAGPSKSTANGYLISAPSSGQGTSSTSTMPNHLLAKTPVICPYAQRVPGPPPPPTLQSVLDNYYNSLCQPAFGDRYFQHSLPPPQYYLEQYQQMQYQAHMQQQGYSQQSHM